MPSTELIRINELEVGTYVRVSIFGVNRVTGLARQLDGENRDPISARDWRRIASQSRRKFNGRVIANDTDRLELQLSVEDPRTTARQTKVRYQVRIPYSNVRRIARLVPQARTFDSVEDEELFRRQFRQSSVDKAYFDPKDRFVAVSSVALIVQDPMIVNFTFQTPSADSSYTVTLPANMFEDGNYTVTWAYNTLAGALAPQLSIPQTSRTATDFVIQTDSGNIDSGTTIDFHVQAL